MSGDFILSAIMNSPICTIHFYGFILPESRIRQGSGLLTSRSRDPVAKQG